MVKQFKGLVIDGKGHLLGRLASTVAKELLRGNYVTVVRCEEINVSGSLIRNKLRFLRFLQKRHLTNPKKGPLHHRAPRRMFWRTVRGNLPYRTPHGMAALSRLNFFEGIPAALNAQKRLYCPQALRVLRLAPGRQYCKLGHLASQVGWKHRLVVQRFEAKRKEKNEKWWRTRLEMNKLRRLARAQVNAILPKLEYGTGKVKIGSLGSL